MPNETFFSLLLPKIFNTTMLTSSLAIYCNSRDRPLLLFGVLLGFFIHIILCNTLNTVTYTPTLVQMLLSTTIMTLSTVVGYNMTKNIKKHQLVFCRILSLVLLPACFISSQSIDVGLYLSQHKKLETMMILYTYVWSIFLCSLIGFAYYYTSVTYFTPSVQKCSYSFVIYFTGAVFASKVFEYMDLMIHPPTLIKNIVFTIRESQQQHYATGIERFKQMIFSTIFDIDTPQDNMMIGTGYSVYWFIISFCLIYDLKKYK